jgi:hypothetical protein
MALDKGRRGLAGQEKRHGSNEKGSSIFHFEVLWFSKVRREVAKDDNVERE